MQAEQEERIFAELDARFDAAVERAVEGESAVTLLYSGGLDSTLVATALKRAEHSFDALVIGTRSGKDPGRARSNGAAVGIDVHEVVLAEPEVARVWEAERESLSTLSEPALSVQFALALAVRAATRSRVLAGQGADELFGGYAHFRGLTGPLADARRRADLARLVEVDWPLSRRIAARSGHDLRSPYLDDRFVSYVLSLPMEIPPPLGLTKPLLRRWARHRGIPERVALEPKHAMQYGSGVAGTVARISRRGSSRAPDHRDRESRDRPRAP